MSAAPEPKWLDLARDAYSASNSYFDASIRGGVEADLRQFQGLHPAGSKFVGEAGRGRSRLFRPKTRSVIRKNEAMAAEAFFSTADVVTVAPEDDNDPTRLASASVMQELLQYRLTKSIPWFQTIIGAYQDAQAVGIVASYQYWEYSAKKKRDRPAIRLVPVENLRFDPGADWTDPVGTSPYIIELIPMYLKDVRARMRTADPKTGEAKWLDLDDTTILQATRQYSDTIRQQREGNRTDSKTQSQAQSGFNVVWVHKNIIEVDETDYVFYTLGAEQLLSKPVPLEDVYWHGRRPYVVGCAVIEAHKTYPSSVPRLTKDVQAEINEVANSRIDNVKLVLNKRYFARRNRQVDLRSITRNVPGSVTLMQDTDDVKTVEFSDVTASAYKEQEILNLDFDDVSGAFSTSSVQSNRKLNETVGGMSLLSTSANQVAGYQLRTFVETWVEPVLRQLVLLEQMYETDETLLALCAQQAGIMQKFGIDAVTDEMLAGEFTLNVNVGMGATSPAAQVEQFMQGMNALRTILADGVLVQNGLKVQEVVKELMGKLGYRDGMRFFEFEEEDPTVAQLKQQVQQLQQALDAKMPPELLAATVRKMEAETALLATKDKATGAQAVKTMVEAEFSAMQGAEVVATLPQVAPIADELMRAAGYTPPTPAGVDPNFPQPAVAAMPQLPGPGMNMGMGMAPGSLQEAAMQQMQPGGAMSGMPGALDLAAGDTSPNTPASPMQGGQGLPESAGTGVREGIETRRFDSVQPGPLAMNDGGLIPDIDEGPDPLAQLATAQRIQAGVFGATGSIDPATGLSTGGLMSSAAMAAAATPTPAAPAGRTPRAPKAPKAPKAPGMQAVNVLPPTQGGGVTAFQSNIYGGMGNMFDSFGGGSLFRSFADGGRVDGGLIQGPGTGTSDTIAAQAGEQPIALSNGEYLIPPHVVELLGEDFFEALLAQFHQDVPDAVPQPENTDAPLDVAPGSFVVPADVVEALGVDFFDSLVAKFAGASAPAPTPSSEQP